MNASRTAGAHRIPTLRKRVIARLRHLARDRVTQADSGCRACSAEDYGPCTCPQDCRHLNCTGDISR